MEILKNKMLLMTMVILTVLATAIPAFASDDNYGYTFYLDGGTNYYTEGHYRQTTNLDNIWKEQLWS